MSEPVVPGGSPYGGPPSLAASSAPVRARRPVIVWDLVLTLILVLPMLLTVGAAMLFSPFLVMASDPCGASVQCDGTLIMLGIAVCFFGPILIFLLAAVLLIVLLVKRRIAFWVPLAGILLMVGVFFLGMLTITQGVPGSGL